MDEAVNYVHKHFLCRPAPRQAATKRIGYLQCHRDRLPDYPQVKANGSTVQAA